MNKLMGLLTIARRAKKLELGMDMTKDACHALMAKGVCVATDISDKSLKEAKFVCKVNNVPIYSTNMTMDEIGFELGKRVGVIAICDGGFFKKAKTYMDEINTDDITLD